MSFFGFFGKIFGASTQTATALVTTLGGAAIGAYNPGLGSLVEMIGNAAYSVETTAAAGATGADKKTEVKNLIDVTAPTTLQVLGQISGKPVSDPSAVAPAIDSMIDDVVALFNALGIFHHAAPQTVAKAPTA